MFALGKDRGIGIMSMPSRKNKALYVKQGCVIRPLAYFRSDNDAREAEELLDILARCLLVSEDV